MSLRWAPLAATLLACGAPEDQARADGAIADVTADAAPDVAADGAPGTDARTDASDGDGGTRADAGVADAGSSAPRILFQCTPFDGGLCVMDADGTDVDTLHGDGFSPRGLPDGSVLFHSAGYRVQRRRADGRLDDLGAGAFARVRPGGDLIFQCDGLAGGLCTMDLDGRNRATTRASGRVPDVAPDGAVLFHTDGYRVVRRDPGGGDSDLGDGAFAVWTSDGHILFQCSGLGGGLCRMARDGSGRTTVAATGRVPARRGDGTVVFHSDDYRVVVRAGSGTSTLRGGANAVWW